jgi:hypothetical protein
MTRYSWITTIVEDPDHPGEMLLDIGEACKELGWAEGDAIEWIDNKDGSWTMKKIETQWVLVEAISTFRERYMVEVPVGKDQHGKDKADWALDTVTLGEAKEFSQEHLGETIVSHRVVTKEEALAMCDKENEYAKVWNDEMKIKAFFTTMAEHIRENDYNHDAT